MTIRYLDPYPKGPCSQIDIHSPRITQIGTTLWPKYIYLDTWTLRVRVHPMVPNLSP